MNQCEDACLVPESSPLPEPATLVLRDPMNREYHKWYSPHLQRDMELLVFGHSGRPVLVFPTSMGRFYDYEDRQMIAVIGDKYERGDLQGFCVDSVDAESWYNKAVSPADRARRHNQYDNYIVHEVVPFIRSRNTAPDLVATGCSFGGYHCVNFSLRHPDIVSDCVSMGGAFDIKSFVNGYYDENVYFNCPIDFLPNLNDPWFLDKYRHHTHFVLATGEHDICLHSNVQLSNIMNEKRIPHWLDIWRGSGHDWNWWQGMAVKFLGPL
jgi:esterase/lipase superfamily enzyme